MNKNRDLAALGRIANLLRDLRLSDLSQARAARQASLDRLADLKPLPSLDLDAAAEAMVALRYQIWADLRRTEIEPVLASQTAKVVETTRQAREAVGKAEVLRKLTGC